MRQSDSIQFAPYSSPATSQWPLRSTPLTGSAGKEKLTIDTDNLEVNSISSYATEEDDDDIIDVSSDDSQSGKTAFHK